jgi:hypothetical protein
MVDRVDIGRTAAAWVEGEIPCEATNLWAENKEIYKPSAMYFTQRGNKAKNRGLHDPMPL